MTDDIFFYIQNVGRPVGNSARWWLPRGSGYTTDLNRAWKAPKEEAVKICQVRHGEDVMWPCSEMDVIAERHVDVQKLRDRQPAVEGL